MTTFTIWLVGFACGVILCRVVIDGAGFRMVKGPSKPAPKPRPRGEKSVHPPPTPLKRHTY